MSSPIHEETVEDAALHWFEGLGYTILHGPDIAPGEPAAERTDFGEVVLGNRLRPALERINPNVPEPAREEAFRKVIRADTPSLVENNRRFHRLLTDGVDAKHPRPEWCADDSRSDDSELGAEPQA
jgi:type I restriction enzyme R subunit